MSGLIGKKIGMTSFFEPSGKYVPCTIVEVGPCVVTQVKTVEKDGYAALQLAFGDKKEKRSSKGMLGHFKKAGTTSKRMVQEFRGFPESRNLGDTIDLNLFAEGDFVDVSGTSKGKGFQGVVKRHNFSGVGHSNKSHGQHDRERAPGSLGASSEPARVFKGKRMAGQMGNVKKKVQNLKILKVMADKNLLVIKGSIVGCRGSFVTIEK